VVRSGTPNNLVCLFVTLGVCVEVKFTPWRSAYIKRDESVKHECVLCGIGQTQNDKADLMLYRGRYCYVLMNLYPYNSGHLMVTPYEHTADFVNLPRETANELFELTQLSISVLQRALSPHGFNLGMNLGRSAGAGIEEHLHQHIVPRWNGDTNFMPILGSTKLIPVTLEEMYDQLRPLFDERAAQQA
jgi:ATP adenylyltransferase